MKIFMWYLQCWALSDADRWVLTWAVWSVCVWQEREGGGGRSCDSAQVKNLRTGRDAVSLQTRRVCVLSVCVFVWFNTSSCPISSGLLTPSMPLPVVSLRSHRRSALPWQCSTAGRRSAGRRSRCRRTSSTASTHRSTLPQAATWVCRHSGRASSTHWGGHAPWWTPPGSLRSNSGRWGGVILVLFPLISVNNYYYSPPSEQIASFPPVCCLLIFTL